MDFFRAQDEARSASRRLVLLFLGALLGVVLVIYLVVQLFAGGHYGPDGYEFHWWNPRLFITVAAIVWGTVLCGSVYKVVQLAASGGSGVAVTLGGELVERGDADPLKQRLINVADEMAIASGVPVPLVYLLPNEAGINAFAAGWSSADAVVAITRGALEQLSRDELQGVVAHEFSHILNGDMRLNMRMMGLLHGLLVIALAGRMVLKESEDVRFAGLGLLLLTAGYAGTLIGELIKAAVSREREFLADAAAVQFTRNPSGIAGALRKIAGGAKLSSARAEAASHMFFAEGLGRRLLASHPPIDERIRRIDPALAAGLPRSDTEAAPLFGGAMGLAAGAPAAARPVRSVIGQVHQRHVAYARDLIDRLPPQLAQAIKEPEQAQHVVFALLVAQTGNALRTLRAAVPEPLVTAAFKHVLPLRQAGETARMPLLELALPALRELAAGQREQFLERVDALVRADGRTDAFELAVTALLHAALRQRPKPAGRHSTLTSTDRELGLLLSLLARGGNIGEEAIERAFSAGADRLGGPRPVLLPEHRLVFAEIEAALQRLAQLPFPERGRLMEACSATVFADGLVTVTEAELLRAVGAVLECPIPPLVSEEAAVAA